MKDLTTEEFAARLAARTSTPGGGGVAAFQVAYGAALIAMAGRFSDGPRFSAHADELTAIVEEADALRVRALDLANADAAAYQDVLDAYRMDSDDPLRPATIDLSLAAATMPPAETIVIGGRVLTLAAQLLPIGNLNLITDAAAGAEAVRAAIATSRVNIEANLARISSDGPRDTVTSALGVVDTLLALAEEITSEVRRGLAR